MSRAQPQALTSAVLCMCAGLQWHLSQFPRECTSQRRPGSDVLERGGQAGTLAADGGADRKRNPVSTFCKA